MRQGARVLRCLLRWTAHDSQLRCLLAHSFPKPTPGTAAVMASRLLHTSRALAAAGHSKPVIDVQIWSDIACPWSVTAEKQRYKTMPRLDASELTLPCGPLCRRALCLPPATSRCYVGFRRLNKAMESLAGRAEFKPEWHAYLLDPDFPAEGESSPGTRGGWWRAGVAGQ